MIENEQQVELSRAARKIAQRAHEVADGAHVTLTAMKWHRGHEVADLDNCWLTLTSDTHAVTANSTVRHGVHDSQVQAASLVRESFKLAEAFMHERRARTASNANERK